MMPIGFRFHPTDEELIGILDRKASGQDMPLHFNFMVERNVYDHEPQDLQWDHTLALPDNERYCFCIKENDSRQVACRGWWKATSHVKKIYANDGRVVGYKRPLTFHRFKDSERKRSNAVKTNWMMHEYSLDFYTTDWRLCKIKYKGKPSVQEELESIRNGCKLTNDFEASSSTITGTRQPTDFSAGQLQQQQQKPSQEQQQSQPSQEQPQPQPQQEQRQQDDSNDSFFTKLLSTYNFIDEDQLQEVDSPEKMIYPSLWSWQN